MRAMHHIPVNRAAGQASYQAALGALRTGEVVGVFPEATISTSFVPKNFKGGSVRLAAEAGVPLVPMAVWGTQRLWTKGRPRTLTKRHLPVTLLVGEPLWPEPGDDGVEATAELRARITALVDRAQREYPDKPADTEDTWWLPAHLGGTAPTPEAAAGLA
jgi:1-acyl-sn-glycerol-3-phosphate acyltransferase